MKPEIYSLMVTTNLRIKTLKLYTKTLAVIFEINGTELVLNTFEFNFITCSISKVLRQIIISGDASMYKIQFKRIQN
jgi:hypothetical protein